MCSCNNIHSHIVAYRKTYDNVGVKFTSDGYVVIGMQTSNSKPLTIPQLRTMIDNVCLYTYSEIPAYIRTVRSSV
jgi:hypothetical protein